MNKKLVAYVENEIFPIYENHVNCHRVDHVKQVIAKSLDLVKQIKDEKINIDMVYAVAAYHDIGLVEDRKTHHIIGARKLIEDKNLDAFFTTEQKKIMAEAIEDHRASLDGHPRNIYGKIVSSADRHWKLDEALCVMYRYRLKHNPDFTIDQIIDDAFNHVVDKFGANGYAHKTLYFKDKDYEKLITQLNDLTQNKDKFKRKFLEVNSFNSI